MTLEQIEASFLRHLYTNLEVSQGVKIFEETNQVDFTSFENWVVIDTLSNSSTEQPKQLWFLHCALQKGLKNEKANLIKLVDKVMPLVQRYTGIPVYDVVSGAQIGAMMVCEVSLSPVMRHPGGGAFRSITVGAVYSA